LVSYGSTRKYIVRNVLGMSFTSLFMDISSESVYAVLPFYILSLGYGRETVGLIEGAGELFASIFKYLSGFLANRIGRYKLLALIGYSLSAVSKPFFALTRSFSGIISVKIVDRIGKGIRTSPRDTLLAASASKEYRGRAFGLHRAMDTVGAILGPLIAAILLPIISYTGIFIISLIPGLLAVLILYVFVLEVGVERAPLKEFTRVIPWTYWLFLATIITMGLAGYTQAFLLIRSTELGWSRSYSIYFLTIANTVYAGLAYPIGYASDVFRSVRVYPLVFIMLIIGDLSLIYSYTMIHAIIFFTIYGIYMAFHDTLMRIVTGSLVGKAHRALAYGLMHGSYGLSALIGYYIVGYLYQTYNIHIAYTYSLIIGLIGLVLSIILAVKTKE
jgi:MFS family permease